MNVNNVVRTITIRGSSEGIEKLTGDLGRLAGAQENVAVVSESSARRTLSVQDAWRKQTLALDEAARSYSRAASATKVADSALNEGLISQQQYAARLDLIAQKYGVVTVAAEKLARAQSLSNANSAQAVNQRLGVKDDFNTGVRSNDIAAYGRQLDDVRAKFNPLFAAGRQYKETLVEINAAAKTGAISEKERSAAVDSTKAAFVQQVTTLNSVRQGHDGVTKAVGLNRYELLNLSRQMQDVGVSLAGGQSPFVVLTQQGSQILDVFQATNGSVRGFFSQAIGWAGNFLKSTTGIVTSVLAIGGAAIFAASQFARASTTIEQALETQNRLLKEGKALLDARTSAEARAQLQSKEQTQFETLRNQLDLQNKLNKAMEDAANLAQRRSGTPTGGGMPEMGIAPTGFAPLKDPGLDKMFAAYEQLKAAQAAGLPGIKQFNAELAKIGMAHPELALVVEDMIKAGEAGMKLEFSALQAKAMADALAGIATNAQMAAVGLGSVAQFKLNNLQAEEARESTERQALAILKIRENWGGVSIEAAKTLDSLSRQLDIASAVGQMAQIEAQHKAKIAELSDRMSQSEATRIADMERAVALARIESQHKEQMVALQGQLSVAQQVTGIGQINAQYEATVALLTLQIGQVKAIAQAEAQRAISIAQANASAEQMLNTLRQEGELIRASSDAERDRIAARQTYQNLLDRGVDSYKAQAVASQQLANAEARRFEAERKASEDAIRNIRTRADAWKAVEDGILNWSVANDVATGNELRNAKAYEDAAYAQNRAATSIFNAANAAVIAFNAFIPFSTRGVNDAPSGLAPVMQINKSGERTQFNPDGYRSGESLSLGSYEDQINRALSTGSSSFDAYQQMLSTGLTKMPSMSEGIGDASRSSSMSGGALGLDTEKLATLERLIATMPKEQQVSSVEQLLSTLQQQAPSIARDENITRLTESLNQLRSATDANTAATQTITDVLSPYYSQDPRASRLGFRAFAGGGIMTPWGEVPLHKYDGGGIATSPQLAMFGENSVPEAYVPVPSGRIPVELRQPANSNDSAGRRPIVVNVSMSANVSRDEARRTGFQIAQEMKRRLG